MLRISYWVFPIISGVVWLTTLLALLLYWIVDEKRPRYSSMGPTQNIAFISDVGASDLKPLFIAGCVITGVFLDISFLSDRWLRHRGRLVPNATRGEKVLSGLTIFFAVVGTVGMIFLSIFDTAHYPKHHDVFLLLFIVGFVLSAVCICWEYQRLGNRYRDHRILRTSFWMKLIFVVVEILLAIGFITFTFITKFDTAAVFEWIIAFIFSAYLFSFYVDLYPAVNTKDPRNLHSKEPHQSRFPAVADAAQEQEMEEGHATASSLQSDTDQLTGGRYYSADATGVTVGSGAGSGNGAPVVPPAVGQNGHHHANGGGHSNNF
ncbi:Frag1/DRAM/Sfk1 family-domain-containing protein [Rhypophila decipiens]|uniref:Frag1/DRAM/Sfk1 family-domain-containing protein n=1 Tax=Rhypophila decipiens TaxID=261697 RepID=A0AAN6Y534_9PEZI|nr:Frag1/DRAM/Sfk1 family-domain-containing protein [Rhypophila decipiens]